MPEVSVIVPVYNVEKYLRQCLDSIVRQSLKDIEIILIDNGAADAERKIIEDYQKNDTRIKVIRFEQNQGYGKAVNTGIKKACGKYISIVESDDFIDEDMLAVLYEKINSYKADIIKSAYIYFDEIRSAVCFNDLKILQDRTFTLKEFPVLISSHPSIWSCLYSRNFLMENEIFFIEKAGTSWVDNPFQLESLYKAEKILYTDKAFYHYRNCRENSSSTLNKALKVPYRCVKDMQNIIEKYNITDSGILYNLALRIMSYIKITIDRAEISDINEIQPLVNELFEQIDNTLKDNPKYKRLRRRFYKKPLKFYFAFRRLKKIFKH